ncbi:MAG: hypothetical protein Q8880_07520 [Bacteroidota bacterium]|nr:hypothetical protein [Bacteroidota bacterium]
MKFVFIILGIILTFCAYSQKILDNSANVYTIVERMPEFPGGEEKLQIFF